MRAVLVVIGMLLAAILLVLVLGRPGTWHIDETALKKGVKNFFGGLVAVVIMCVMGVVMLRDLVQRETVQDLAHRAALQDATHH